MNKRGIFVSGTDTGIGKTLVSSLLLAGLRAHQGEGNYFKPVQTGSDLDRDTVSQLNEVLLEGFPRPVYQFPEPISPHRAAALHDVEIRFDLISDSWRKLPPGHWIVEGAGGLLVPLNKTQLMRDLIAELQLPLLLVTSTRLGTLNHTLMSVEAARTRGLALKGLVLLGQKDPGLKEHLEFYTGLSVVAEVPYWQEISPQTIQSEGPKIFHSDLLRSLF